MRNQFDVEQENAKSYQELEGNTQQLLSDSICDGHKFKLWPNFQACPPDMNGQGNTCQDYFNEAERILKNSLGDNPEAAEIAKSSLARIKQSILEKGVEIEEANGVESILLYKSPEYIAICRQIDEHERKKNPEYRSRLDCPPLKNIRLGKIVRVGEFYQMPGEPSELDPLPGQLFMFWEIAKNKLGDYLNLVGLDEKTGEIILRNGRRLRDGTELQNAIRDAISIPYISPIIKGQPKFFYDKKDFQ